MKYLLVLLAAVMLTGCEEKEPTGGTAQIGDFRVAKLFEYEGCRVYRFSDGGNMRYFTNCSGSTEWARTQTTGKTTRTYDEGVYGSN